MMEPDLHTDAPPPDTEQPAAVGTQVPQPMAVPDSGSQQQPAQSNTTAAADEAPLAATWELLHAPRGSNPAVRDVVPDGPFQPAQTSGASGFC